MCVTPTSAFRSMHLTVRNVPSDCIFIPYKHELMPEQSVHLSSQSVNFMATKVSNYLGIDKTQCLICTRGDNSNMVTLRIPPTTKIRLPSIQNRKLVSVVQYVDEGCEGSSCRGYMNIDIVLTMYVEGGTKRIISYNLLGAVPSANVELKFTGDPVFPDWLLDSGEEHDVTEEELNIFMDSM